MPLSEHEQRVLDQIEKALYADDPKFASAVRTKDLSSVLRRRFWLAAVIFVLGFVLLLMGINEPVVGIVGFVVMLSAAGLALSAHKRMGSGSATLHAVGGDSQRRVGGKRTRAKQDRPSKRQRLEERWERRRDERGD